MIDESMKQAFLRACEAWICDGYSLDLRFIASSDEQGRQIWDASIELNPLPAAQDYSLSIDSGTFAIAQLQRDSESKESLLHLVNRAASGVVEFGELKLTLPRDTGYTFASEMSERYRWASGLHLQVLGRARNAPMTSELLELDNQLRTQSPPFDGLVDVANWLGLRAPGGETQLAAISIRVAPPVELSFDDCRLSKDQLDLSLRAHPDFITAGVGLAVRTFPGNGLESRLQVASSVAWADNAERYRKGKLSIAVPNADSALVMLMVGSSTVRRHWFVDSAKARNSRLLAVRQFDGDLQMIKRALFELQDSQKFELGVAALLFLLGYNPSVQIETNAPDIVVATPRGQLVLVECTTRIADVASKVGKLVDRRGALAKAIQASGSTPKIFAALVCRLPRDQIASYANLFTDNGVILIANEEIADGLNRITFANDPDKLLDTSANTLWPTTPVATSVASKT